MATAVAPVPRISWKPGRRVTLGGINSFTRAMNPPRVIEKDGRLSL